MYECNEARALSAPVDAARRRHASCTCTVRKQSRDSLPEGRLAHRSMMKGASGRNESSPLRLPIAGTVLGEEFVWGGGGSHHAPSGTRVRLKLGE